MITKRETDIYDDRCHWILESQIYFFKLTDTTRFLAKLLEKVNLFDFMRFCLIKCILIMGKSMGSRHVDPATTSESIETFRVCRVFCAYHFGNKFFPARMYFYKNRGQILFWLFCIFFKKIALFSKNR
jgi:hypothetical protein